MPSPVEICNLALGWLGANLIHALNLEAPESTEEELCAANYPAALRVVLEAKGWTFATERVVIENGEESGVAEYPRRFLVPATVVRVLGADDGSGTFELRWVREGKHVLTADVAGDLHVKAVLLVEDALRFPPAFTRALALRLAADLAIPLTENRARAGELEAQYLREVARAGSLDGSQGSVETKRSTWLHRARGG